MGLSSEERTGRARRTAEAHDARTDGRHDPSQDPRDGDARHDDPAHDPVSVHTDRGVAGLASAGLVFGVLATLAGLASLLDVFRLLAGVIGVVLAVAAVILGAMAWARSRSTPVIGSGTPITATVFGILGLVLSGIGVAMVGAELQDADAALEQLQQEAEDLGTTVTEGAGDLVDEVDEAID